jgi:hypothetical protein
MSSVRGPLPAIAAASDGTVLVNLVEQLPGELVGKIIKHLGGAPVFVGVLLNEREASRVVARIDNAAAEAAATVISARSAPKKPRAKAPKSRRR